MGGEYRKPMECPHNEGVYCKYTEDGEKCETCGWNPDVSARRLEDIWGQSENDE